MVNFLRPPDLEIADELLKNITTKPQIFIEKLEHFLPPPNRLFTVTQCSMSKLRV